MHEPDRESVGGRAAETGPSLGLFLPIWFGQVVSTLGSGMVAFAIGVTVFQGTGSVSRFALIGLAGLLPNLLLSPLAGTVADRVDRRLVLIAASLGAAACNLLLYYLVQQQPLPLWLLYAVIAATSACNAFVWPTFSAATTLLVGRQHLGRASGLNQIGTSLSSIISPTLAALLMLWVDLKGVVLFNLVSYLVPAAILLLMRFPQPEESAAGREAADASGPRSAYGWRFIRARPGLLQLLLVFASVSFCLSMVHVLLTPMVLSFASPLVLGLVLSVAAGGTLVGGIVMAVWGGPPPGRRVRAIFALLGLSGALLLLGGWRADATLVAAASFFFVFGYPILGGTSQVLWQTKVPPDVQGRVFAIRRLVAGSASPLALVLAGPLADGLFEPWMAEGGALARFLGPWIGVGPGRGMGLMLVLLGLLILLVLVVASRSRALSHLEIDLPDALDGEEGAVETSADGQGEAQGVNDLLRCRSAAQVLVLAAGLVLLGGAAWLTSRPPAPASLETPLQEFSAQRAYRHVQRLASQPRPVGSPAHRRVRAELVEQLRSLGLETQTQSTTSWGVQGSRIGVVRVHNVLGRWPGRSRGKAVLLVAHYDSVATSPGAGDNAAAVSALLETARALSLGGPLERDVIFLFSDGEEVGLHGARAFVREHPWARRVAVLLNFDARGHGGPVYMFRASGVDGPWLRSFLQGAPFAATGSLMDQISRRLPNQTDLTVFQQAGLRGFDFAFVEGLTHYHGARDRAEDLDLRSLQHQGQYALALARHFATMDLPETRAPAPAEQQQGNRTWLGNRQDGSGLAYFNLLGSLVLSYPGWLAWLSGLLVVLFHFVLIVTGLRRGRLTVLGLGQGFLGWLGLMVAVPVALTLCWQVMRDGLHLPMLGGSTLGAGWLMLGMALLALTLVSMGYAFFRRVAGMLDFFVGGLLWWSLAVVLSSGLLLPASSNYLFVWPLLGALVCAWWLLRREPDRPVSWRTVAVLLLGSVPGLCLLVPFSAAAYVALQAMFQIGGGPLLLVVMLLGLLVPALELLGASRSWRLPAFALAGFLVCAVAVATRSHEPGPTHESSVLYTHDTENGESYWYSFDKVLNPWLRSFGLGNERGPLNRFLLESRFRYPRAAAPDAEVARPRVEVLSVDERGELRELRLRLDTPTHGLGRWLWVEPASAAISASLAGADVSLRRGPGESPWVIEELPLPPDSEELMLRIRRQAEARLVVVEHLEGLPQLDGIKTRPADSQPPYLGALLASDTTLVRSSVALPRLGEHVSEPPGALAEGQLFPDPAATLERD